MYQAEIEKTVRLLESRISNNPNDEYALLQLAELYYQLGHFDTQAREVYEAVINKHPREAKFQNALSISLLLQQISQLPQEIKQISETNLNVIRSNINNLKIMLKHHPDNQALRLALANLLMLIGEIDEAIEEYKLCMKYGSPRIKDAKNFFKLVFASGKLQHPHQLLFFADFFRKNNEPELALNILLDLYDKGEISPAVYEPLLELLQNAVAELEEHDDESSSVLKNEYLRRITDIYLQRNELYNALQTLNQLEIKKLRNFSTVKKAAQMLINYGDFSGAFKFLSQIPLDEEAKALINQMTLQLEKRGELDTATYLLQFINENDITIKDISEQRWRELEIRAEIGLGILYLKKKQYQQALDKFISAIKHGFIDIEEIIEHLEIIFANLTRVDPGVLKLVGWLYLKNKNYYKAAEYYSSVLASLPEDKEARQQLRIIYNNILAKNPQMGEIRLKSGDLYLMEGDNERALIEYQEALSNPFAHLKAAKKIAAIHFKNGDIQLAFEKLKNLPLEEEDLPLIYNIMQAFINNEDFKSAKICAELIVSFRADYRDTATILESLRQQEREFLAVAENADDKIRELIGDHAVGRYHLVSKIASGGMGVIYKVFDRKLGKYAAMKVLREELSNSERVLERFFREARIAASVKHPNIVDIYDFNISHTAGHSYISMEYIEGRSLRQIIEDKFTYSPELNKEYIAEIVYYISQLCSALEATHKRGIIHRDIKPDNLLITKEGLVKITDFGIAHVERATMTPAGALIGTPRYMSPEQVRGAKIDGRADIYAVGIVLYECLVGSPPFIAGDIAYQQVNIDPPEPKEIVNAIPEKLNALIMKCLKKDPNERYQTATELRSELEDILVELGGYQPTIHEHTTTPDTRATRLESDLDL